MRNSSSDSSMTKLSPKTTFFGIVRIYFLLQFGLLCLCLADALKLKNKVLKILKIFPIEEIEPKNKDSKFALKITPFENMNNFIIVVEYLPKFDMMRVIASVGIGQNLINTYAQKSDAEKMEIVALFAKHIVARNFNPMITNNFSALEGYKLLFEQNMSAQKLFDTVNEALFLLQDLWALLYQADQSLKAPPISQASQNMFQ